MKDRKRIVVIGGGPGGYSSAIRASDLGASVTLVEGKELGGVCLNRGCIPTKVFLSAAELLHDLQKAEQLGIGVRSKPVDLKCLRSHMEDVVLRLRTSLTKHLSKRKVKVLKGKGIIKSPSSVLVSHEAGSKELACDGIVIATGSHPADLKEGWVGAKTTDDIFHLGSIPRTLAVIGGGPTGIELSTIFSEFGSDVTLFEAEDRILPEGDADISQEYRRILEARGVGVHVSATIRTIEKLPDDAMLVTFTDPDGRSEARLESEEVLTTIGRRPNVESLWIPDLGIKTHHAGWINVDEKMETSVSGIYAVGDVTGGDMCAHSAIAQGITAAESMMGEQPSVRLDVKTTYVSSIPEIAWVGMTEQEARVQGRDLIVGSYPVWANSRSAAKGESQGFVKILADGETGEILGFHAITDHAADLAIEVQFAMSMELCLEDIASTVHPHPTHSEIIMEAARSALSESVHI